MATDNESFNRDLYELLKVRGYKPVPLDSKNQRVLASQAADVIEFTFTKDGEDYGKAWVSIDDAANIIVYYDEEQQESPNNITPGVEYDDSWTGFLKHLKNWAQRRQLSFELSNKDRLGDDMKQRDYYKMKEKLGESYHAMGKKASYNDAVPNVKIVLQHNRSLEEGEARFRNVARIYLENVDGERFLAPTNKPGIARVYARHIAEGGVPNDEKWNHIKSICEDYNKMAGFVRATRNVQFNESAQELVNEGINHYNNLRETLHKLSSHRGYHNYFESWSPPLMEDELDESINELFVQEMVDPRIESAMPILSRLKKPVSEMAEVDSLAEWADSIISEKLELEEMDKEHGSTRDFGGPKGPDKTAKPLSVKKFAKGALKSLKRGMLGWEKGMHDVETVKRNTATLSPSDKEDIANKPVMHPLRANPRNGAIAKGSPAELQQKLIKREKNKKVDEVLDTRDAKMSYAQKNMDSHKKAFDKFIQSNDPEEKAGAHKTAMKRVKGLNTFVKNKVSKDEVEEAREMSPALRAAQKNLVDLASGEVRRKEDAKKAAAKREREYAKQAARAAKPKKPTLDQIWQRVEHAISNYFPDGDPTDYLNPYIQKTGITWDDITRAAKKNGYKDLWDYWNTLAQDIENDAYGDWLATGGKNVRQRAPFLEEDQINETYPSSIKQYASDLARHMREEGYEWEQVDLSDPEEAISDAREQLSMFAESMMCDIFGDYDPTEQLQIIKMFNKKFGNLEEDLGPEQKRVGQLGPTGGPAKVGDLVGANESTEFADELTRIIDIARFNR